MKKILFFICTLDDGGAQRVVSILASKLVKLGFGVEILKYYKGNNIYPLSDEVKVTCVEEQTQTNNIFKNLRWMSRYFINNCDIIISFLASYNMLALLANKGRKPIIVADRNDPNIVPKNSIIRYFRNRLYKKADCVVLQTKQNKEYFEPYVAEKSIVIENPMNLSGVVGRALLANKEKTIVNVGRLAPQKNQIMLINAFARITDEFNNYKLLIYGDDDSSKEQLQSRINELNLNERVILKGRSLNVIEDISKSELFVLSSDYEGMPNALIEAMCIGLPVISTKVSGSAELIIDGENGFLVDIGNESQLAEKMKLILSSKDLMNKLSTNATNISKIVDVDVVSSKWKKLIEKYL